MARPDTDDGWLKYAHELDAAIACGDFTKAQRKILRYVFAQIYGPAKLRRATLKLTPVSEETGISKPHICHAAKALVECGVLQRFEDKTFGFVKDYESWTRADGSKRLDGSDVKMAKNAANHAMSFKRPTSPNSLPEPATDQRSSFASSGNKDCQSGQQINDRPLRVQATEIADSGNDYCQSRQSPVIPPLDPPVERARGIQDFETRENTPLPPKGGRASTLSFAQAAPLKRQPGEWGTEEGDPSPSSSDPKADRDPEDLVLAMRKAEDLFPGLDLGARVRVTSREYAVAWISEALDIARDIRDAEKVKGKIEPMRWSLVRRILVRFHGEGVSDSEKAAKEFEAKRKTDDEPRQVVYFRSNETIDYSKLPRITRRRRAV